MTRVPISLEYDLEQDAVFIKNIKIADRNKLWDVFRRQGLFASRGYLTPETADRCLQESLEEFLDRGGKVQVSLTTARKRAKAESLEDLDLEME